MQKSGEKERKRRFKLVESRSSSATESCRGVRDRAKWRKKRQEKELKRKKSLAEEEFAKKRGDLQKKEFRRRHDVFEKILGEWDGVLNASKFVIGDYRQTRERIKVQVGADSNNISQSQQFEAAQISQLDERIKNSEIQLATIEQELTKLKKINNEFVQDSVQSWMVRFWKWIY